MTTGPKAVLGAVDAPHARARGEGAGEGAAQGALDLAAEGANPCAATVSEPSQAELALGEEADRQAPLVARGPGRPPGARNRRTRELAEFFVRRYGDPLAGCLALAGGSLVETAKAIMQAKADLQALGIAARVGDGSLDLMALLALKQRAAEAALPYIHARLAPTDDKGNVALPILNIGVGVAVGPGAAGAPQRGGGLDLEALAREAETVVPQGFADDESAGVS